MNDDNELIIWTTKLSCGIKLIDDQHRGLVDLVNEMFNHVTGNHVQERDYFNNVIHQAIEYVKYHFSTEEKILLVTDFCDYAKHKKEHDHFVLTIIESVREYEAGERFTLSSFTRFLRDWILSHIALMDREYFEHIQKISVRKPDGRLSINLED